MKIAERQLFHAIELYIEGEHLISAITLAGAAEEILGRMLDESSNKRALDDIADHLCSMYEYIFKETVDKKKRSYFVYLRNRAKNAFKHIEEPSITLDLEQEAVQMISRAIRNYRNLKPNLRIMESRPFLDFEKVKVDRYHERCRDVGDADL